MKTLVMIRHGQSEWNKENRFTGWVDVPLSEYGYQQATEAGISLKEHGYDFDRCFTSLLKRAIDTLQIILQQMDREWLRVDKCYELNERHYGALQGLNKEEVSKEFGEQQVHIWRRSYMVKPPILSEDSPYNPKRQAQYRDIPSENLPLTESLEDTFWRSVPFFVNQIQPLVKSGKRILISAHGNSLRSLMKYIEHISDKDIADVELPTGIPLVYQFDDNMHFLNKFYLD